MTPPAPSASTGGDRMAPELVALSGGLDASSQVAPGIERDIVLTMPSGTTPRQVAMETGRIALQDVGLLIHQAQRRGFGPLAAIANDKQLQAALHEASGALRQQGNWYEAHQAARASLALPDVIQALKNHEAHLPSLRAIGEVLTVVKAALGSPEKVDLAALLESLASGQQATRADFARIEESLGANVVIHSESPVFRELVGTPEARQQHAERMEEFRGRLENVFRQRGAKAEALKEAFLRTSAALLELRSVASRPDSRAYIDAVKEVLSASLALRKRGLSDEVLDTIIQESVVVIVAAQTGGGAVVKPASRKLKDRLVGLFTRRSTDSLGGALGDDPQMRQAAKLLVKAFDVQLVSQEELCRVEVGRLKEAALVELREVARLYYENRYSNEVSQKRADEFLSMLAQNVWIKEAERIGIGFLDEFSKVLAAAAKDPIAFEATIVREMLASYSFDEGTGLSRFTAPAWVSDVDAIHMLACKGGLIGGADSKLIGWIERLPLDYPELRLTRDYSTKREVVIQAVVPGTTNKSRPQAAAILRQQSLVFSDPRDQVVAHLLHLLKHNGSDLFCGLGVRGAVPGFSVVFVLDGPILIRDSHPSEEFASSERAFSGSPARSAPS